MKFYKTVKTGFGFYPKTGFVGDSLVFARLPWQRE